MKNISVSLATALKKGSAYADKRKKIWTPDNFLNWSIMPEFVWAL